MRKHKKALKRRFSGLRFFYESGPPKRDHSSDNFLHYKIFRVLRWPKIHIFMINSRVNEQIKYIKLTPIIFFAEFMVQDDALSAWLQ